MKEAGHPRFYELTREEEDLHSRKNADYAGRGAPLGNFHRIAAIMAQYPEFPLWRPEAIALVFGLKQLDAVMFMMNEGRDGDVETIGERLADLSNYSRLARILHEEAMGVPAARKAKSSDDSDVARYARAFMAKEDKDGRQMGSKNARPGKVRRRVEQGPKHKGRGGLHKGSKGPLSRF